jgi:two-component system, cell cycle response regulator CpdR
MLRQEEERKVPARAEASEMGLEALNVLSVDDDPAWLSVTCRMLEAMGCQVDAAGDGVKAMECMRRKQYDVVVSDMHMPVIDGFTLACWIKRKAKHTQVIIMTGQPMTKVNAYMNTHVADYWLFKPFVHSELRDVLQKIGQCSSTPNDVRKAS